MIVLSAEGLSAFQVGRQGRGGREFILLVKINDRIVQASDSTTQTVHLDALTLGPVVCRLVIVAGEGETATVAFSTTERPLIRSNHPEATPDVLGKAEEINLWMTAATRRA